MSDQITVSRELLRNVKREVDDLRDERDALLEQLRTADAARDAAPGDADLRAQLDRAVERTVRAAEELTTLRAELASARSLLAVAQAETAAVLAEADALRRTHPMPPPRTAASPDDAAPEPDGETDEPDDDTPAGIAGRAFAAWCRRNRALVSRPYLFASFLKTAAAGLDVDVTPVYRDRAASVPTFRSEAVDGVEHWLVRIGPATVLLPQPLSAAQFRELAPCFTGEATPETLAGITPATVSAEGTAHVLAAPGRVVAE